MYTPENEDDNDTHNHLKMTFLLNMVIFHGYVFSLLKGTTYRHETWPMALKMEDVLFR